MYSTVNKSDLRDAFRSCGRGSQFSYAALGAIFDQLAELERDSGQEFELDPIGICCEYQEMSDLEDFNEQYGMSCKTISEVQDLTLAIPVDGGRFVIMPF